MVAHILREIRMIKSVFKLLNISVTKYLFGCQLLIIRCTGKKFEIDNPRFFCLTFLEIFITAENEVITCVVLDWIQVL